jgi:hypothetical protein
VAAVIGVLARLLTRVLAGLLPRLLRVVLALLLLALLLLTLLLRRVFVLVVHAFLHVRGQRPELAAAMEKNAPT